jgi:hypothetical protein
VGSKSVLEQALAEARAHQQMTLSRPERELVASAQVEQQKTADVNDPNYAPQAQSDFVSGLIHTATGGFDEPINAGLMAAGDFVVGRGNTYAQRREQQTQNRKAREDRSPLASGLGGATGFAMSPVTKLAGPSASVASQAAVSGVQSAASGFNEAEGGLADKATAGVKSGVIGAGASALAAGAAKGIGALASRKQAAKEAVKALGGSQADREAIDAGLKKVGDRQALGEYLLDKKIVTAKDSVFTIKNKVEKELQTVGEQIGQHAAQFDDLGFGLDPKLVMGKIRGAFSKLTQNNAAAEQIRNAVAPALRTFEEQYVKRMLANPNAPLKLSELHAFQASLKNAFDKADGPARQALVTLEKTVSDQLMEGIESASKFYSKGKIPTQYLDLKRQYQMLALAQRAAESGVSKAERFAQNDLVKAGKFLGGIGGFIAGGPAGAIKGAIAGALAPAAQQRARSVVASALNQAAKTSPAVGQAAAQAPQAGILEVLRQMGQ